MTGTSRVQKQHQDNLLLNSQVAGSCGCWPLLNIDLESLRYLPILLTLILEIESVYLPQIVLQPCPQATPRFYLAMAARQNLGMAWG